MNFLVSMGRTTLRRISRKLWRGNRGGGGGQDHKDTLVSYGDELEWDTQDNMDGRRGGLRKADGRWR
jgi:hypothetical protein